MITRKFILRNIDCTNCATKIENEVNEINGLKAKFDFESKLLILEMEKESDFDSIMEKTKKIIYKLEPDALIEARDTNEENTISATLTGLSCANCAAKIEKNLLKLDEINFANVDFVNQKMSITTKSDLPSEELVKKIAKIANDIDPGLTIDFIDKKQKSQSKEEVEHEENEDEENIKKQIFKFVLGGLIFAVGLIFKFSNQVELIIFLISYVIVGGDVVVRAIKGIFRGQVFSEFFLMSIATIGAFVIGEYPEGVAVMLFYMVGELFQDMALGHSRKSITALMEIRPEYANLKVLNEYVKVAPEEVKIGDYILVKPGERVPLDGTVIEGTSTVDTAAITGESVPREIEKNSDVLSGYVNLNGVITVQVTKIFAESTVSKILELVQNASSKKAPTEKFITKFASYYTPVVVFAAIALALLPPLVLPGAEFSVWVYRALVFLVISCPCALVISIPLGFFGGIGGASKRGILVKGSNYLEALNNLETVVFDKTGTLTKGVFKVTDITALNGFSEDELIEYSAYAESLSTHPIAKSILSIYKNDIINEKISDYQEISGQGIKVNVDGKEVLAGNTKLMTEAKIDFVSPDTIGTTVHIAVNQVYVGYIIISDEVKEDAATAIRDLKKLGIKNTIMLTGDISAVGIKIGKQLGLDEVYTDLLPSDKVSKFEMISQKRSKKGKIAFVGDGINDAPVLARADIGIAMGGLGSDAAIEAADIVIMTDEPSKLVTAIRVAKKTRMIVFQNILFALVVKGIFLVLGALGVATMWEAVFADTGVALLSVFNAMRVMSVKNL